MFPPPESPDRWARLPPLGWWVSTAPPTGRESAGPQAYRCPRCHQTVRLVVETGVSAATA